MNLAKIRENPFKKQLNLFPILQKPNIFPKGVHRKWRSYLYVCYNRKKGKFANYNYPKQSSEVQSMTTYTPMIQQYLLVKSEYEEPFFFFD